MYTSSEFYLLKAGLVMAYVLPRMSYLSYRLITAAFFLSNLAYLIKFDCETIYKDQCWKFLIYLTNWGLLAVNCRLALDAALNTIYYFSPGKRLPRLERWLNTLYNLSNGMQLVITISFWALLYTEEKYGDRWYLNHYEHTMPLLMCVLDVAMSPYRRIDLVKGYQPFLAGVAYLVFSLLFELGGGKNALGEDQIYPVLGWRHIPAESSALSAVTLLALFLSQGFFWSLMEIKLLFKLCLQAVREEGSGSRRAKERKSM